MDKSASKYEMLKMAYDFLNRQISRFEKTVEIQVAEYHLLEELGAFTDATKVQLTRFQNGVYSLINEWKKGEAYDPDNKSQGMVFMSDPVWTDTLGDGKPIYVRDVEHISEELDAAHDEMKNESIRSMYVIPVSEGNRLIAIITICNPGAEKVAGIEAIRELLGNWLGYRLVKNDNRVQKTLDGLGADYTAAFMINVDTDYFEVIINQKSNNSAKQKKVSLFTDYVNGYVDKYVVADSQEHMRHELNIITMRERFETQNDYSFTFQTTPNEIGQTTFQAHAVKEYGPDGRHAVVGFRCVDDILKKEREYQAELDRAYQLVKRELDIVTAAIPGGVKISYDDPQYSFKYVSEQYATMLGYDTVEEFMEASGGTIVGIAHPDDLETGIAEALRQYEVSDNYAITYRMRCKDGTWKYIEDHGHKVHNEDGTVEHWNLILDKNELVEKTVALESEKKASTAKTAFLARMSHDIRTPLNGIIGLMEINRNHPDDRELVDENREKARVAADHLLSLINDVLELNKLGDSETVLCEEPFSVREMIQEVKTITEIRAASEGISLTLESSHTEEEYPCVMGSPLHIKQIFINIITNAIKYNHPGGTVHCYLEETILPENQVHYTVRVKDNGIGMSKQFLKHIFSPFAQEAQDARSVYQGTGLGMSIVKNLVDRMGGTVQVESEEGVGTTVEVSLTLPLAETGQDQEEKTSTETEKTLEGRRVLVAEDNELNREIATFLLEDEKMIVTEACDGYQAVNMFLNEPEHTFDLILMDIMMPVKSGLQAAREIRRSGKADAKTIPIFAMTANAFIEDKQKAKDAGMNEHISKPLDPEILFEKIREYVK